MTHRSVTFVMLVTLLLDITADGAFFALASSRHVVSYVLPGARCNEKYIKITVPGNESIYPTWGSSENHRFQSLLAGW